MKQYDIISDWEMMQGIIFKLKEEWNNFIMTGEVSNDINMRTEVYSSWIRCRERHVDPYNPVPEVLSTKEISDRRKENKRILDIVEPLLREAAEGINDKGLRFDFFDKDLYLLERIGEQKENATPPKRELRIGTSFKEFDYGTNAVSLAMLLEKPVQLMAFEHYCVDHHDFTTTAVPIRDGNGKIVAVISTDLMCWPIHTHTIGMLIALKRSIEYSMSMKMGSIEANNMTNAFTGLLESSNNAMVIVNASGIILAENSKALALLSKSENSNFGVSCETLWGSRNPFIETIISKKPINNREVTFDMGNNTVRMMGNVVPIFNKERQIMYVSGTFWVIPFKESTAAKKRGVWKAYYTFENLIGESEKLKQTIRLAKETAKIESNTLIQGESGTGKELFAQAIHNDSNYREGPFVAVNCSAIPIGLLETELFGYEKGAFTGASNTGRIGKFEVARGGTLFLDEINSMPLDMQGKLLRAIQNKSITRVGGNEEIPINIRIIAATNVDLWDMVRNDTFREDLFYRINVISIILPPLRERIEDIPLLADYIDKKVSNQIRMNIPIDEDAMELMKKYSWPGNVRELENVIERSIVLARAMNVPAITREILMMNSGFAEKMQNPIAEADIAIPNEQIVRNDTAHLQSVGEFEKQQIEQILQKNDYNISKAAKEMGVVRNTLYNKMKKYGISIKKHG